MLEAVPARIVGGVAEAEVGTEVDDRRAAWRTSRARARRRRRGGGRGRPHRHPATALSTASPVADRWGWTCADRDVRPVAPEQADDLDCGMAGEEPDQLGADVAGGARRSRRGAARRGRATPCSVSGAATPPALTGARSRSRSAAAGSGFRRRSGAWAHDYTQRCIVMQQGSRTASGRGWRRRSGRDGRHPVRPGDDRPRPRR